MPMYKETISSNVYCEHLAEVYELQRAKKN